MATPFGDIGPCEATFDGVSLGENHKATFKVEDSTAEHKTAKTGTVAKDEVYVGRLVTVEVLNTESTIAQLSTILPSSTVTSDELMVANPVGTALSTNAGKMVLKPFIGGVATADATKWITCFRAAPVAEMEIGFDAETDREYKATFKCFPATSTIPSGETYTEGDIFAVGYGETT